MSNDIGKLQDRIIQFRDDRDWRQFHTVKDLLLGLNIELAELQELFLWKKSDVIDKDRISDEVADIFIFLTYLCREFDLDLQVAVTTKLEKNSTKYPVDKSKGSNKKYTEL